MNRVSVTTVPAGDGPIGVAVNPDGARVYVTNGGGYSVSVIDTATNTVTATIPVVHPNGVAVSPDGAHAYVTSAVEDGTVSVIDTATNTVTATIPVGNNPSDVAVSPDGNYA